MKVDYQQLDYLHPLIKEILADLESTFRVEFTNTSNIRPGDNGVHGVGRGWDLACNYEPLAFVIADYINGKWIYDHERPRMNCCVWHDNRGSDGRHIHIQVHPNTIKTGAD